MTGSAPTSSPAPDRTAGAADTPGTLRPSELERDRRADLLHEHSQGQLNPRDESVEL